MARHAMTPEEIDNMRQRLSQAALDLYKDEGFEAVSFRSLATRLGISHTLPYRYFDSKEALFAQIRVDCLHRLKDYIVANDPGTGHAIERIVQLSRAISAYVKKHPDEYRLMFSMSQPPLERHPELLEARRAWFDYLVAIGEEGAARGEITGDPRALIHVAWAAAHGALGLHAANQLVHGLDLDALIEPMLETIFGPLLGGKLPPRQKKAGNPTEK